MLLRCENWEVVGGGRWELRKRYAWYDSVHTNKREQKSEVQLSDSAEIYGFQTKADNNRVSEKISQAGVLVSLHISFLVFTENCADLPSNFLLLHSIPSSLK